MPGAISRRKLWEVLVSPELDRAVERAVKTGKYLTKSELIRSAVQRELERLGIDMNREEAAAGAKKLG